MPILNVLPFTHQILANHLQNGDTALDGTAGNGHDTVFLADAVGDNGQVWAFDIQRQAIEQTKARLLSENLLDRVQLVHDSHRYINRYIGQGLDAAVFNFGWLPGGDKSITTSAESSLEALNVVLTLLNSDGIAVAVLYPGHDAGRIEANAIESWAEGLPQQEFSVLKYCFLNRQNRPPYVLAIQKLRRK